MFVFSIPAPYIACLTVYYRTGVYLCDNTASIAVASLAKEMKTLEKANKIDSSSNLSGSKVFVYHGAKDDFGNQIKVLYVRTKSNDSVYVF